MAVLFDMDGVLVNSEDYWVAYERDEVLPHAVPHADVAVSELSGMNYLDIYDYLETTYGTRLDREAFVDLFDETAREIYGDRVALLESFPALCEGLQARSVPLALVSSSPRAWIDIVLERFDLEGAFDAVVSGDTIDAPGKPEPDIFTIAADAVEIDPADCVAVEDSEHGVESAARAGVAVVAYRIDAHDDLDLSRADRIVDSPKELREAVLDLVA